MNGIELAKFELINKDYTCVIVNGEEIVMTSTERGVKPLILFYEELKKYCPRSRARLVLADKVIGRASALLAALCGIESIYAEVISVEAKKALEELDIPVTFGRIVPYIKNRTGDGRCPMEELSLGVNDPYEVYQRIKKLER